MGFPRCPRAGGEGPSDGGATLRPDPPLLVEGSILLRQAAPGACRPGTEVVMRGETRTLAALVWVGAAAARPALAQQVDTVRNQKGRLTAAATGGLVRFFEYDDLGRSTRTEHVVDG